MKGGGEKYVSGLVCLLAVIGFTACLRAHGNDTEEVKKPANRLEWQPLAYDSTKKYIYLSFDDGPQHGTVTCYDLCKKEAVKASFFMVGLHSMQKSDGKQIVAMIRNGYPEFLLANHSYSHARGKYLAFYHHPLQAEADFLQAQDLLHVPYKIARLPGNRSWVREGEVKATDLVHPVAHLLDSAGYNVIGWDAEWHFRKKSGRPLQSATQMAALIDSTFARKDTHVANHLVLLTHDRMFQRPSDADSLAKLIHILKQNPKYVFETVDHYPGLKRPVHRGE
ncbi:MAG: polysaccharide deacetylase family protein [Bacteroidota bacterium]